MNDLFSSIGDNVEEEVRRVDASALAIALITTLVALVGGVFSVIYP